MRSSPSLAVTEPECLQPLDVEFIIDRSGSMGTDSPGATTRLSEAQAAAKSFVDTLDGAGGVGGSGLHQVGLVSFGDTSASIDLDFASSSSEADFDLAIDGLTANGYTPTKQGMAAGLGELTSPNRRAFVEGVPVTHAYVLLSDGRPWSASNPGSDPNRPSGAEINAYLLGADQAFSIMLGESDDGVPISPYTLDPVLMNSLAKPAGSPSANFYAVAVASDLGNIFDEIVNGLLCGDLDIVKTADPTALEAGGGSVEYTYLISHIGEQGSAPFTDVQLTDTLGAQPGGDLGCSPLVRGSDNPGDDDNLLEQGETWVFTCEAEITENTQNWGCVDAEYVGSSGARAEDCDDAIVVVDEAPPEVPDIKIRKSHDATGTVEPGTEVTYSYEVENIGETALSNVHVVDFIAGSDEVACEPVVRGDDISGNDNNVLDVDEIWSYSCSTELEETTANRACVTADSASTQSSVSDCDREEVEVSQSPEESEPEVEESEPEESEPEVVDSPEQSVKAGTGTPVESQPDASLNGAGGDVLPTILFSFVLITSLGTLAYANVRAMRGRS
ncbi:MAG: VWA domain-containing protein [Chloroflexota bacterium]|nr:VWA domain-containing protein [Chloroflexota bacterium]